ncbi:hypothetical protein N867_12785 [Actinotalea fermentans ATCC 43279 = JCM 9966 = DSM 3133]|nr:hypothetical protein N867_12785 [Actinotalea fermentans ATCC 43279 = JCM 9966 = DSM 3133]
MTRKVTGLVAAATVLALAGVLPATAGAGLVATAPTTALVVQGTTTALTGMGVTGAAAEDTLAVTVATSRGTVQVDTVSTGVALAYNNLASGASVSFTGKPAQVNAALATTTLTAPAGSQGQSATVTVTAYQQQAGIVFGPATGHFYEFVPAAKIGWDTARTAAAGRDFLERPGYLVTITSSAENAIVTSRIPQAKNVWIGAKATGPVGGYAREWRWDTGPEAGTVIARCTQLLGVCDFAPGGSYGNWASGEPNNQDDASGGEWVAVTNWNSFDGLWNDLAASNTTDITGYVVEYGDAEPFVGIATASSTIAIAGLPGSPTGVSATTGPEQATVSFTAPASDGGAAVTSYTVTASPGGASTTCASSPCAVTGLTAWTSYTFTVTATNAVGAGAASAPSAAVTVEPIPYPPSYPYGPWGQPMVGQPFTEQVTATGFPAPTFAVTAGALPAGLVLAADGTISGTPTTPGPWSAQITATNTEGSTASPVSGHVGQAPTAITGSIGTLPLGTAASLELDADGYPVPTWSVTAGALPEGLALAAADGAITGTPTAVGPYSVTVRATNAYGAIATTLTGWVSSPPELIAGTTPQLLAGVPASVTYTVDGYPPPTFAVTAGALPSGMTLSSAGVLSGTPSAVGPWSATITATNDRGSVDRTIGGHVGDPPSAVSGALSGLVWGTPVTALVSATGYPAPTFAVTAGALPAGLDLDPVTGAITGTPTSADAYSVTITASNAHGARSTTLTGAVAPIRPTAPTGLLATSGDGEAALTFQVPASDGGAPVTGYQVRVGDGPWQALTTTRDGATATGTVFGLVNGDTVDVAVRAVNAAGPSPASGTATVTPVAPPPMPVAAPTGIAGVSSVTLTWDASTERDVSGYTVTSDGRVVCEVPAGTTTCLVGAVAGEAVTFQVVTHSRWGDSAPSASSVPVVPSAPPVPPAPPTAAPATLTTTDGPLSSVVSGQTITVLGTGFVPFSTAVVVVYSEPRVLGTALTDEDGAFSLTVTVPTDLAPGEHTFVALGTDPSGAPYAMRLPVTLPAAATAVADTGAGAAGPLALTALILALGGVVLLRASRGGPRRSSVA